MSTITVRGLDDDVKQKIRVRAAAHGRSMEAEVREILTEAVSVPSPAERKLGTWLVEQLGGLAGDDPSLFDVRQHDAPRTPDFSGHELGGDE
ncbi:plasmid stabilization protein [Luteimicrobium album]|uniref:Plasmid stabilization protein n=1 Tax=Luteimicrobium album TaxID=1054550 RepID=A0ABQ6HZQ5_9MICO|nr:Arc family DNA-binding protein [Luteimicrobium album]GMA23862.1 plasmid stabilization protein [Luteimicrobium album]